MNQGRLLNMVLSVALVASLIYNFVLYRQSEAAIFRGPGGEIVAVSGLVNDISSLMTNNSFSIKEPSTGDTMHIRVGQSTHIRVLDENNTFTEAGIAAVNVGSSVFVYFTEAGIDGVAKAIDILPGLIIN